MQYKFCLATIMFLLSSVTLAEYLDPNAMKQEEYRQLRQVSIEHEECMNEYAISQLHQSSDIRVIADHAMKHCASILERLNKKIIAWQYPPEFSSYYVSGISNRNGNKILRRLMRQTAMSSNQ